MRKEILRIVLSGILGVISIGLFAQANEKLFTKVTAKEVTKKGKYTLVFVYDLTANDKVLRQRLTDAFFAVYPKEAAMYNRHTARKVTFFMDPAYDGVAATGNDTVRFNPEWFRKHPDDIDVVTHEVMHIVQAYPDDAGPGWITEGIADYVRYKMGVDNAGAGWKLPDYNTKQNYDNAYRITARFFIWIEQRYDKDFVKQLDAAMRGKKYKDDFAKQHTGKTFDQLWQQYAGSPAIN